MGIVIVLLLGGLPGIAWYATGKGVWGSLWRSWVFSLVFMAIVYAAMAVF